MVSVRLFFIEHLLKVVKRKFGDLFFFCPRLRCKVNLYPTRNLKEIISAILLAQSGLVQMKRENINDVSM